VRSIPTFDEYISSLGRLTAHVDPTAPSAGAAEIKDAASSLARLSEISVNSLSLWVDLHPHWVPALGLAVGLSQEKLKNILKNHFDTQSWRKVARESSRDLVRMLDNEYDVVRLVTVQRGQRFTFGDILVARAGTRSTATRAGASGRRVENEIEAIAKDLHLRYETRTRFAGRNNRTAPCDLAIPGRSDAAIVVAAKAFDSTGSKLTDAVREIEEMAEVRLPRQYVIAVIDGIGWKSRRSDLRRIYDLWSSNQIDGMYTLASLGQFRDDLREAARLRGLL
jgi:hypothetical protein